MDEKLADCVTAHFLSLPMALKELGGPPGALPAYASNAAGRRK